MKTCACSIAGSTKPTPFKTKINNYLDLANVFS